MRNKDENKRIAICNAAINLITENGFADTSMSKIAKGANISSSTIYIYFKNKEDMLNKLYLWVKEESAKFIFNGLNEEISIKGGIERFIRNVYDYIISEPVKFSFGEQFANSPILKKISISEGKKYYFPLFNLLQKGIEKKIIKNVPVELLSAFILAPIMHLVKQQLNGNIKINDEMISNVFKLTWDSIKV